MKTFTNTLIYALADMTWTPTPIPTLSSSVLSYKPALNGFQKGHLAEQKINLPNTCAPSD